MDRGAWQAAAHGVARVGHDLALNQHHHTIERVLKPKKVGFKSKPEQSWASDLQANSKFYLTESQY